MSSRHDQARLSSSCLGVLAQERGGGLLRVAYDMRLVLLMCLILAGSWVWPYTTNTAERGIKLCRVSFVLGAICTVWFSVGLGLPCILAVPTVCGAGDSCSRVLASSRHRGERDGTTSTHAQNNGHCMICKRN
jgi:hypothetical protein